MSSTNPAWTVRAAHSDDDNGTSRLFQQVFGRSVPEGFWDWKYRKFPVETENEWVAESSGRIVGHYAVSPVRFKILDRESLVPHGCDAMTHPDYRRQGILSALGRRANEKWRQAGAPFQIGFHYGGWGSVREALGWQPVARLLWMKRRVAPFTAIAHRYRLPCQPIWSASDRLLRRYMALRERSSERFQTSEIQIEQVEVADERFDRLWTDFSPSYGVLAVRDRAWVQWRYLDMPGTDHRVMLARRGDQPLGYLVMRVTGTSVGRRAAIVDCFVGPNDKPTVDALLQGALSEVWKLGAPNLAALVAPASALYEALSRAAFRPARHGYDFSAIPYTANIPNPEKHSWLLTGAEGDVL
jgi:predicted N-acetyltransferase YhbS